MAKGLKQIGKPSRPGKPGGLGDKVEATLQRVLAWAANEIGELVSDILTRGIELVLEALAQSLAPYAQPVREAIVSNPAVPEYVRDACKRPSEGTDSGDTAFSVIYVLSAILGGFLGLNQPSQRLTAYLVDRELYSARPDPPTAWAMAWRTGQDEAMIDHLRDLGWHDSLIAAWRQVVAPRLSIGDLFAIEHLERIPEAETDGELRARGYQSEDIPLMRRLSQFRPGPQDLIRMAVREAWRDDVAQRWGYDSDFPPEFAEWMERLGDADGWAQKYWRAHWDLPGLNTVLDVLYRVPDFTIEDLDTYLRVQDVPAVWRDYIKQVAYREYTRVDTRRMFKAGVLDEQAVLRSYLAQGYDEEHAANMTAFTIADAMEEDREATKGDILQGYNAGILSEGEASEWLQEIGYPPDVAGYLLEREAAKRAEKLKDRQTKAIRNLYLHNELTVSEARTRLTGLGLPGNEIDTLLEEWELERVEKLKRPTQGKLDQFLKDDVITEGDYREGLESLGYQDRYIDWYLAQVLAAKAEAAAKEEKAAREEQEKLRVREVKSDYQIAKAQLDVDGAELRTAIAETQQALVARQERYRQEIALARRVITREQLEQEATTEVDRLRVLVAQGAEAESELIRQIEALQDRVAQTRLELEEKRESIEPDVEALRAAIAEAEEGLDTLQTEIEQYQTEIATLKLAVATESEEITAEEAAQEILARQVLIEEAQDSQAALELEITQTQEALRLKEAEVERIARQLAEYNLSIEQLQTERAEVEITTQGYRTEIERVRAQLRADLAGLEIVRSVAEIEEEYLTDHEMLSVRLAELRANLAQVQEGKALLTVGFREAQRVD